jgi:hypothetical protein
MLSEPANSVPAPTTCQDDVPNISSAKRTGENGLLGIEWHQSAGLSLDGM